MLEACKLTVYLRCIRHSTIRVLGSLTLICLSLFELVIGGSYLLYFGLIHLSKEESLLDPYKI